MTRKEDQKQPLRFAPLEILKNTQRGEAERLGFGAQPQGLDPDALRHELAERFAETMTRHQIRRSTADFERAQKAKARKHGLQRRHAQKLARLEKP